MYCCTLLSHCFHNMLYLSLWLKFISTTKSGSISIAYHDLYYKFWTFIFIEELFGFGLWASSYFKTAWSIVPFNWFLDSTAAISVCCGWFQEMWLLWYHQKCWFLLGVFSLWRTASSSNWCPRFSMSYRVHLYTIWVGQGEVLHSNKYNNLSSNSASHSVAGALAMLAEVEAVINTWQLTYVNSDFLSGFTLTILPTFWQVHWIQSFLVSTIGIMKILSIAPKRTQLNKYNWVSFGKCGSKIICWLCKRPFPLCTRTQNHKFLRHPKIGEIVIVKDDNLPCRA